LEKRQTAYEKAVQKRRDKIEVAREEEEGQINSFKVKKIKEPTDDRLFTSEMAMPPPAEVPRRSKEISKDASSKSGPSAGEPLKDQVSKEKPSTEASEK